MALNHITIAGRLTADPELRHTQSGKAVASYTVACERDYQSGGSEKQVDFINCVSWDKSGEFVGKWFHKGNAIIVDGKLQMRSYEDRNGNKRTVAEVVTNNVYFGESKRKDSETDAYPAAEMNDIEDDGELPF